MTTATVTNKISNFEPCNDCGNLVPLDWKTCPHCARPQLFPNVRLASHVTEREILKQRYQAAAADAQTRGCSAQLVEFETACQSSSAVFRCELLRLQAEIASGTDVYKLFRDIERLRLRYEKSTDRDWPALRTKAERDLLGNDEHLGNVHYASISLNGEGVKSYGDTTVKLRENMIAHRSTCVEGNSADLFAKHGNLVKILRSTWDERGKLCVAKAASNVNATSKTDDFPNLILQNRPPSNDDDFVEVIIFGTMTAGTFDSVTIQSAFVGQSSRNAAYWDAVKEKLVTYNVRAIEI